MVLLRTVTEKFRGKGVNKKVKSGQSNTYKNDLGCLYFNDETRVPEKQHV